MNEEENFHGELKVPLLRDRQSLAARGAAALKDLILSGVLTAGAHLNEGELSQLLGISRSPLREAMRALASQGILTIIDHKGAFVSTYSMTDIQDLYDVRTALETFAARRLARESMKVGTDRLTKVLDATSSAIDQGFSRAYPEEFDFHIALVRATGNRHLQEAAIEINQKVRIARLRSGRSPERAQQALNEHRGIVMSLLSSDEDSAAVLVAEHVNNSMANLIRLIESAPGLESDLG